jgi:hypothetical protein
LWVAILDRWGTCSLFYAEAKLMHFSCTWIEKDKGREWEVPATKGVGRPIENDAASKGTSK